MNHGDSKTRVLQARPAIWARPQAHHEAVCTHPLLRCEVVFAHADGWNMPATIGAEHLPSAPGT
eukprot:11224875-Lingulodinium_polyedra.AAC.1